MISFDAKLSGLNRKVTAKKSKHWVVENELKKLKTFDSSCFRGKIILKKLVHKTVYYFSRCTNILKK